LKTNEVQDGVEGIMDGSEYGRYLIRKQRGRDDTCAARQLGQLGAQYVSDWGSISDETRRIRLGVEEPKENRAKEQVTAGEVEKPQQYFELKNKLLKRIKMPRIYRYAMWFLATVLVAKFVFNIERVILFLISLI